MTRFVEQAIERAGLGSIIPSRRRGDLDAVRVLIAKLLSSNGPAIDLLALGAVADAVRTSENGEVVSVHESSSDSSDVTWILEAATELDLLRAVAIARVTGPIASRIGVDWGRHGLELAQVALGFGATDLVGPITRKNGLVILEDDKKKVKGLGMVAASALKRREIAALIHNAGRLCEFVVDRGLRESAPKQITSLEEEAAHVRA